MSHYRPHMMLKVRSKAIMRSGKGQPCKLRIASFVPGRRCGSIETTVNNHISSGGKGTSTKDTDMATAHGCDVCHAILDGRDRDALDYIQEHYPTAMLDRVIKGLIETHADLIDRGIIIIPDAEIIK